jgi:hypothetical protein
MGHGLHGFEKFWFTGLRGSAEKHQARRKSGQNGWDPAKSGQNGKDPAGSDRIRRSPA